MKSLLRLASPHPLHPLQISKAAAKAAAKKQQQKQQHTCSNSDTPYSPFTLLPGHSPLVLTVVFFIVDRRFWGVTTPLQKLTHICQYFFFSLPHNKYIIESDPYTLSPVRALVRNYGMLAYIIS
jgi:hypothetical protein